MCELCETVVSLLGETEYMANGASRFIRVHLLDGVLNIERITRRKKSFDIDYLARMPIEYCPKCGAKLKEVNNNADVADKKEMV